MAYLPPNILEEVYTILSSKKVALNKILIGVEPIKVELIKKFFNLNENMQILNGYGPTETTICCTAYKLKQNSIISTNIGGIPEIVVPGQNGFIMNPGDKKSLYNAINKLMNEPNLCETMGYSSIAKVQEHLPQYVEQKLSEIYQNILST